MGQPRWPCGPKHAQHRSGNFVRLTDPSTSLSFNTNLELAAGGVMGGAAVGGAAVSYGMDALLLLLKQQKL